MLVIERKLRCVNFCSQCNVVVRNVLVLVLEENPTCITIPSWCNVFDDNVAVQDEKLTHVILHSPRNVVV